MQRRLITALLATGMPWAVANAQEGEVENRHDGFYLRLTGGFGGVYTKTSVGADDDSISGGGADFSLGLGGAVRENLILLGELSGTSGVNPTETVNGQDANLNGLTLFATFVGAGINYYFMPLDLYVGGSLGAAQLSLKDDSGNSQSTKFGFGLTATVGKEWWVSTNWGIGLAARMLFASTKADTPLENTWTTTTFGLAFSATYN
jgi:hypothetical protein